VPILVQAESNPMARATVETTKRLFFFIFFSLSFAKLH
jgi:hypothetical protein